ncbi:MAG: tetratricopeptide repeat protein [Pyrinomonadaceae bacterium]
MSAHGVGGNTAASVGPNASDKAPVATPELDAKIEKATAKVEASKSSPSTKKAAASAYMERGNFYYTAGDPRLYRYALGDFRRALRLEPEMEEAREKITQIEDIYKSMNRPVPNNGLEP